MLRRLVLRRLVLRRLVLRRLVLRLLVLRLSAGDVVLVQHVHDVVHDLLRQRLRLRQVRQLPQELELRLRHFLRVVRVEDVVLRDLLDVGDPLLPPMLGHGMQISFPQYHSVTLVRHFF